MVYTRKRWASSHILNARREELRRQARDMIVKAVADKSPTTEVSGIHLMRGCDLRASLEEKAVSVHGLAKWTAFVNRAGTLVHMVPREGDMHVRIPFYYSTLSLSDRRLLSLLWGHVEGRLK